MSFQHLKIENIEIGYHQCMLINKTILIVASLGVDNLTPFYLGGKGCSLVSMVSLGLSVPKAVIFPTTVGKEFIGLSTEVAEFQRKKVHDIVSSEFVKDFLGIETDYCSVRSGAMVSMAGMMDTILNVGAMHPKVASSFLAKYKDENFAHDCKERFIATYNSAVYDEDGFSARTSRQLNIFLNPKPDTPITDHYTRCVSAVFNSFNSPRSVLFRRLNGLDEVKGTACIIQKMVYGNQNSKSCTGVAFSRNPTTGEDTLTGEYLVKAQGEDVVSGAVTPLNLDSMWEWDKSLYKELKDGVDKMANHFIDVRDVEFTVENGKLWFLQTRTAKMTATASIRSFKSLYDKYSPQLGTDMTLSYLLKLLDPNALDKMRVKTIHRSRQSDHTGLGVCEGAVCGIPCTTLGELQKYKNVATVFIATETTPNDLPCFALASAIVTTKGGSTSHAAVVARSMGVPCVVGVEDLVPDVAKKESWISVCGDTGEVWLGHQTVTDSGTKILDEFIDYLAPLLGLTIDDNVMSYTEMMITKTKDIKAGSFVVIPPNDSHFVSSNLPDVWSLLGNRTSVRSAIETKCREAGVVALELTGYTPELRSKKVRTLEEFAASNEAVDLSQSAKKKLGDMEGLYQSIAVLRRKVHGVPLTAKAGTYITKAHFLKALMVLKLRYP